MAAVAANGGHGLSYKERDGGAQSGEEAPPVARAVGCSLVFVWNDEW
ncbi:MAG: hypothetical protein RMK84_19055 [Oscillochloridaceae bacterium]|nr:hypothetical protein [Chloroflexaceae bacterium]MDW8392225.1 hypothetical protein [Oscillochloridaceae bacterium]